MSNNPTHLSDADVAAIRARVDATSDGPWTRDSIGKGISRVIVNPRGFQVAEAGVVPREFGTDQANDNAEFIAHAPTDIRALLAALATAQQHAIIWHPVSEVPPSHDEYTVWVGGDERGALYTHRGGGFGWFIYDAGADDLVMLWPTHWRLKSTDPNLAPPLRTEAGGDK